MRSAPKNFLCTSSNNGPLVCEAMEDDFYVEQHMVNATSGAHFFTTDGTVDSEGNLVVTFDEAGVGQTTVKYNLTANVFATYGCLNKGGKNPCASNKQTTSAASSATATFNPKNGRIVGTIIMAPIPPAATFKCPSGQKFVLASVSYTDIVLTDQTNNVVTSTGDVARNFFPLCK